ncbi:hypothetical protein [Lentibacillus juripiscarius]|uniref:hypothetical protein n=1 Tax=Lentibacillus juripiscarius TaxID=257446 RepID=UPI0036D2DC68
MRRLRGFACGIAACGVDISFQEPEVVKYLPICGRYQPVGAKYQPVYGRYQPLGPSIDRFPVDINRWGQVSTGRRLLSTARSIVSTGNINSPTR